MNRILRLAVIFSCGIMPMATLSAKVMVSEAPPPLPPNSTVLLAFGNSQSYRGINMPSPDLRGNFWNSVGAGAFNSPLKNAAGEVTTLGLGFDFAARSLASHNGPSGATQGSQRLRRLIWLTLGYLGIKEAVYHYYVNSTFQIRGLDPTKVYSLTFFGSHKYSPSDYTTYSICSDASYSKVVTSMSLYVQSPGNPGAHNSNKVRHHWRGLPAEQRNPVHQVWGTNRDSTVGGYLNCMQIVDMIKTNASPGLANPSQ